MISRAGCNCITGRIWPAVLGFGTYGFTVFEPTVDKVVIVEIKDLLPLLLLLLGLLLSGVRSACVTTTMT